MSKFYDKLTLPLRVQRQNGVIVIRSANDWHYNRAKGVWSRFFSGVGYYTDEAAALSKAREMHLGIAMHQLPKEAVD